MPHSFQLFVTAGNEDRDILSRAEAEFDLIFKSVCFCCCHILCIFSFADHVCVMLQAVRPFVALGPQGNRAHGDTDSKRNLAQGVGAPNPKRVRLCSFCIRVACTIDLVINRRGQSPSALAAGSVA